MPQSMRTIRDNLSTEAERPLYTKPHYAYLRSDITENR